MKKSIVMLALALAMGSTQAEAKTQVKNKWCPWASSTKSRQRETSTWFIRRGTLTPW